ncbi:uncharacterized protein BYT42DRAFT_565017 [Radiomyces spectabilis]|uniref:uncharacterized protein n=1 Tax=Radiomyces spectabilis TaxID=64574 RepID=UPI00221E895D|nr:uncharacterized protein BYT42DRAFT_565017 [Radiomyces spectabilis]KAI8381030.1 hypothetical protein BYT42DRAFT_565017 [Radiomyces spectabilis]
MSLRALKSSREIISRLTSGAAARQLPSNVSKISLSYAIKGKNESASAKHFLHESLPCIQYNNPNVEFELKKSTDPSIKPTVTVHFGDRSKVIDISRLHTDLICDQLFDAKP